MIGEMGVVLFFPKYLWRAFLYNIYYNVGSSMVFFGLFFYTSSLDMVFYILDIATKLLDGYHKIHFLELVFYFLLDAIV